MFGNKVTTQGEKDNWIRKKNGTKQLKYTSEYGHRCREYNSGFCYTAQTGSKEKEFNLISKQHTEPALTVHEYSGTNL